MASLTADDLSKFAQDEGVTVESLCRKPECRDLVQRLIFNDQFRKLQFAQLSSDLISAELELSSTVGEEVEVLARLSVLEIEDKYYTNEYEKLHEREEDVKRTMAELEKERNTFADKKAGLEVQVKQWSAALAKAQQAQAKAIWKKPGEADDEDDALSYRSLGSGGFTLAPRSHSHSHSHSHSRGEDDESDGAVAEARRRARPYDPLAADPVLDYSEKLLRRLSRVGRSRGLTRGGQQLQQDDVSLAAMSLPTAALSPIKAPPHFSSFRTGTSSASLSLDIGRNGARGLRGRRADKNAAAVWGGASDDVSVGSVISALTSSTAGGCIFSSSSAASASVADGPASSSASLSSLRSSGSRASPSLIGKLRVKPQPPQRDPFALARAEIDPRFTTAPHLIY